MFEQGFRSDDNKQQIVSYGMCVTCLALVSPENAWILKPKTEIKMDETDDEEVRIFNSFVFLILWYEVPVPYTLKVFFLQECLEIYELADVKREYELSLARTKLLNCPSGT